MILRQMTAVELLQVLDWAATEGWNPGLADAAAFYATDPKGFFAAEIDGQIAAAISVVNHDEAMAFLGLYMCLPEYRGQGIGFALWNHALAHAGSRCVGLDGVAAQQANYARSGFVTFGSTTRWAGHWDQTAPMPTGWTVGPVRSDDVAQLMALDRDASGFDRSAFLQAWLSNVPTRRSVLLRDKDELIGFATLRECRDGAKIGPIIAPDLEAAIVLIDAVAKLLPGAKLSIDLPESSGQLAELLESKGFTPSFVAARMYRGVAPVQGPSCFAIATMELG